MEWIQKSGGKRMKQPKESKENKESKETKQDKERKNQFEEKPPILSRSISLSKDRKWLIFKTIRTDIIHINYMDKILQENKNEHR